MNALPTPIKGPEPAVFPSASQHGASESNSSADAPKPEEEISILLVEDNRVNQKVISGLLRKAGMKVYITTHGAEALDFLRTTADWVAPLPPNSTVHPEQDGATGAAGNTETTPAGTAGGEAEPTAPAPDQLAAILMDISMPIMDGFTCTRQIREYQSTGHLARHIPIIALCPSLLPGMEAKVRDVGMDDAVKKPVRITELLPKLETLLQQFPPPRTATPASVPDMAAAPS